MPTTIITDLAIKAGSNGYTVAEMESACDLSANVIGSLSESMRYPLFDEKLPRILKTNELRDGSPIYIHLSQMANYTFARAARMREQNPEFGIVGERIEDVVNEQVVENANDSK